VATATGFDPLVASLVHLRDAIGVLSVYVPNGKYVGHPDFELKLAWLGELGTWLAKELDPAEPLVVAGDFNICPGDLDTFDPVGTAGTIFHTDAERAMLASVTGFGLTDLFRHLNPEARTFSWWDYRAGNFHKGIGLRIDLVYGATPLVARASEASIDRNARKGKLPSDHAPVVVDFADRAGGPDEEGTGRRI